MEHQYPIRGKRVDLALKQSGKRRIFIEIKTLSGNLKSPKSLKQIKGYLKDAKDVELGVLTNLVSWIFFKRHNLSESTIIRLEEVNIQHHQNSEIIEIFNKYLTK